MLAEGERLALGEIDGETEGETDSDSTAPPAKLTLKATKPLSSIRPVVPATCRASQFICLAAPLFSVLTLKTLNGVSSNGSHWSILVAVEEKFGSLVRPLPSGLTCNRISKSVVVSLTSCTLKAI